MTVSCKTFPGRSKTTSIGQGYETLVQYLPDKIKKKLASLQNPGEGIQKLASHLKVADYTKIGQRPNFMEYTRYIYQHYISRHDNREHDAFEYVLWATLNETYQEAGHRMTYKELEKIRPFLLDSTVTRVFDLLLEGMIAQIAKKQILDKALLAVLKIDRVKNSLKTAVKEHSKKRWLDPNAFRDAKVDLFSVAEKVLNKQ